MLQEGEYKIYKARSSLVANKFKTNEKGLVRIEA